MSGGRIISPKIGSIVKYVDTNGNAYDVYITDGSYKGSNGRVSNFWDFKKIKSDGSLGSLRSGYGNFFKSDTEYQIDIKITKK